MKSVDHGNNFEGMYKPDLSVEMKDKHLEAMLFSNTGHFSGYALRDKMTNKQSYHLPFEFKDRIDEMVFEPMSRDFLLNYDESHTRLLGFRSGKRCKESKAIRTIQPIFYSVNEKMC